MGDLHRCQIPAYHTSLHQRNALLWTPPPLAPWRCPMHFKSLRHVRDHVKVQGRPYELLTHIALHTNMHTGEAFELSVERQALRHAITPEWTRRLLNGLIATGELIVERSR